MAQIRWPTKPGLSLIAVTARPEAMIAAATMSRACPSAPGAVIAVTRFEVSPVRSRATSTRCATPVRSATWVASSPIGAARIGPVPPTRNPTSAQNASSASSGSAKRTVAAGAASVR